MVGSPQEVTEKILAQHEIFGHSRFLAQMSVGTMPHGDVMRAIELLGTEVAPAVRAALGDGLASHAPSHSSRPAAPACCCTLGEACCGAPRGLSRRRERL